MLQTFPSLRDLIEVTHADGERLHQDKDGYGGHQEAARAGASSELKLGELIRPGTSGRTGLKGQDCWSRLEVSAQAPIWCSPGTVPSSN